MKNYVRMCCGTVRTRSHIVSAGFASLVTQQLIKVFLLIFQLNSVLPLNVHGRFK